MKLVEKMDACIYYMT